MATRAPLTGRDQQEVLLQLLLLLGWARTLPAPTLAVALKLAVPPLPAEAAAPPPLQALAVLVAAQQLALLALAAAECVLCVSGLFVAQ